MAASNVSRKYALITGATSGFGYEFAKLFAKDGYNLVLVARNDEKLQELAADLTQTFLIEVLPIAKDLFNPSAAAEIYSETQAKGIVIDALVNNAGQGTYGLFAEYDSDRDVDMIQLNITSLVCLTKLYLKEMIARNEGKILQVASLLGKYPTPYMSVYAASKAFVVIFTEGLINELKGTQVTVTALLPGPSDTDFFHKAGAEETVTYKEEDLSNPAVVARDGFEALMNGESRIVSGIKNKVFAVMSGVMPDSALASTMEKKMRPSGEQEGRSHITHGPSIEERDRIDAATGNTDGDYQEHEDHVHTKE
ncbi:SDR family NAD(P)-dependent oxidoreductase [Chryseosolibacter indicus]|uniref:SDR family oxidoreductase n=1 Tax=Chryseosolibacter indicus TaxID=2782351 RepID=A0ABS5VL35_9BACT|nr:SDR family oxidoreductase [Chryseosolibacter indicus]MBT1702160.1 SDR family oxidoreductase [Chryseosolibacter indicus]